MGDIQVITHAGLASLRIRLGIAYSKIFRCGGGIEPLVRSTTINFLAPIFNSEDLHFLHTSWERRLTADRAIRVLTGIEQISNRCSSRAILHKVAIEELVASRSTEARRFN